MKKQNLLLIGAITATAFLSGCTPTQPTVPMTKDIKSFKDYIVKKRANTNDMYKYNIIAEKPHETIIEYRTKNEVESIKDAGDVMEVLDDAKEYCRAIGGNGIYGDQAINRLNSLPTAFSLKYIDYKKEMRNQGTGHYGGFYKCASLKDGFEIDNMKENIEYQSHKMIGGGYMNTYSRYYHIVHDKPQKIGSKFWFKNDGFKNYVNKHSTAKDAYGLDESGQFYYKYEKIGFAQKYCSVNGGKLYIANNLSSYKKMSIEDYYFAKLNELIKNRRGTIFTNRDYFWCENQNNPTKEFTLVHTGEMIDYKQGVAKEYLKTMGVSFEMANIDTLSLKLTNTSSKLSNEDTLSIFNQKIASSLNVEKALATFTIASKNDTYKTVAQLGYETSYNVLVLMDVSMQV